MGIAVERTIEKLRQVLLRHADKLNGVEQTSLVQIIITTDDNETCEPVYRITKKNVLISNKYGDTDWTFREMINATLDVFGAEETAREYLRAIINNESIIQKVEPVQVQIRVVTGDNNDYPRPVPFVYVDKKDGKGFKDVRQLNFAKDIFQEA